MTSQLLETGVIPSSPAPSDVLDEWLDPHLPSVFARWHPYHVGCFAAVSARLIEEARVGPGQTVLDIGAGSGIPTLAIARAVGPTGQVVATDPSPVFVAAIAANARAERLLNVRVERGDAAGLSFSDATFDAATCQMGVMFFPDLTASLQNIGRMLRPGARAAFSAWGAAPENALFTAFWGAARPYLPPDPEPAPDGRPPDQVPGPMRFAVPGSLSAALRIAGFDDVIEETRQLELIWPGSAATLRDF